MAAVIANVRSKTNRKVVVSLEIIVAVTTEEAIEAMTETVIVAIEVAPTATKTSVLAIKQAPTEIITVTIEITITEDRGKTLSSEF
jgi:hypothetical protein